MDDPTLDILVIEDDPDARENLRDLLEMDGQRVEVAGSAAEAMASDHLPHFAAIILDRRLPDATAERLMPRLKAAAPEAAVIVVTGYSDLQGVIAALRQGAEDYLIKPLNHDLLRASLARIAERRRLAHSLEEARERAVQAERLAAIGEMVAGLAHESRNALQRSQACLEMLSLTVRDRPEAIDLIARIQNAQDDLHTLYEDVRGYASPIKLDCALGDLSLAWRESWENLASARNGMEATLVERIQGVNLHCVVDLFRMGQVFRNLLDNALAAGSPPIVVEVAAEAASMEGRPALRLRFRDNGPGIPPERRGQLFDPFFTTKARGTGLGLAIARRIVEAHGGRIEVGEDGPGASFFITLPRGLT